MFEAEALYLQAYVSYLENDETSALTLIRESIVMMKQVEGGMTFRGPTALGINAMLETDEVERQAVLQAAEELLSKGCVSHNYLEYYEYAIQACLRFQEWDEVTRLCEALEDYIKTEPLARCELMATRGRLLAEFGRGRRDPDLVSELRHLQQQFSSAKMQLYLPAIEKALSDCETSLTA